jgi:hypothetical protein
MYKAYNNVLYITKGNSAVFDIDMVLRNPDDPNDPGTPYTLEDGDAVILTVKSDVNSNEALIEKTVARDGSVKFVPSDTESLAFGTYVYDVKLTYADGDVATIITPHWFKVMERVSN